MAENQIKNVSYTHESMISWLILNPDRPLRDAAAYFGYTQSWVSTVLHSDAFQKLYRQRQDEVAAVVAEDIPGKLRACTDVALDKLVMKIEGSENADFLLNATDKLLHRMGYAPASQRSAPPGGVVNNTQTNNIIVGAADLQLAREMYQKQIGVPAIEVVLLEVTES